MHCLHCAGYLDRIWKCGYASISFSTKTDVFAPNSNMALSGISGRYRLIGDAQKIIGVIGFQFKRTFSQISVFSNKSTLRWF